MAKRKQSPKGPKQPPNLIGILTDEIDAQAQELLDEFKEHRNEVRRAVGVRERQEITFVPWAVQKIAGLQVMVMMLDARLRALEPQTMRIRRIAILTASLVILVAAAIWTWPANQAGERFSIAGIRTVPGEGLVVWLKIRNEDGKLVGSAAWSIRKCTTVRELRWKPGSLVLNGKVVE